MVLTIGQTLGPYRILEQIGRGGMATVHKGYHAALDRNVAIKVLPPFFADDPAFLERFRREAATVARLRHPNILAVFDSGEQDGTTYIVTELVEGGTLADLLGRPLPALECVKLLAPIASALDYAHEHGVVHRDLKPSNVLIHKYGTPVLSDFGLAYMFGSASRITRTGMTVGTPEYMAPEQAADAEVGPTGDVYSLAVVLYEALTGSVPFSAETPLAVVLAHLNSPLPLPSLRNPSISDTVERVVLKGLAKSPEDRYQSAGDMLLALELAAGGRGAPVPPIASPQIIALPDAPISAPVPASLSPLPATRPATRTRFLGMFAVSLAIVLALALALRFLPVTSVRTAFLTVPSEPTAPSTVAQPLAVPTTAPAPTASSAPAGTSSVVTPTPEPARDTVASQPDAVVTDQGAVGAVVAAVQATAARIAESAATQSAAAAQATATAQALNSERAASAAQAALAAQARADSAATAQAALAAETAATAHALSAQATPTTLLSAINQGAATAQAAATTEAIATSQTAPAPAAAAPTAAPGPQVASTPPPAPTSVPAPQAAASAASGSLILDLNVSSPQVQYYKKNGDADIARPGPQALELDLSPDGRIDLNFPGLIVSNVITEVQARLVSGPPRFGFSVGYGAFQSGPPFRYTSYEPTAGWYFSRIVNYSGTTLKELGRGDAPKLPSDGREITLVLASTQKETRLDINGQRVALLADDTAVRGSYIFQVFAQSATERTVVRISKLRVFQA